MKTQTLLEKSYVFLLSDKVKETSERVVLSVAIASYLLHLLIIFLNTQGVLSLNQKFFQNPIAAIYTPFSFILIYEVFLLVYFLPKSIAIYIGKQYEIITLIVIRRVFKDIAYLKLDSNWFQNQDDLQFTFDVITSMVLFFLIYLFYKNIKRKIQEVGVNAEEEKKIKRFINLKKTIAVVLIPILVIFAAYSLISWLTATFQDYSNGIMEFKEINNIFFDEFFTVLIVVDVLLLMASFFYSDQFHKIIRNSGFVLSTILMKISFFSFGLVSNVLIIGSVAFGCLSLIIHNLYEKNDLPDVDL